ncbi:MAG: hypothetical protein PHQ23_07455 [Candidatus Wallbacteria bacterium]|nr:hypothetical protein [Candidatus Wallbacteria bacterium]
MSDKVFPVDENLLNNHGSHAISLFIVQRLKKDERTGINYIWNPSEKDQNATLTLISSDGKYYGLTCKHVIEHFRAKNKIDFSYSLMTVANRPSEIIDDFIFPDGDCLQENPDIAVCELTSEFIEHINKTPIDLDNSSQQPSDIDFGFACGFPTKIKESTKLGDFIQMSMPMLYIVAGIDSFPAQRFKLYSELSKAPDYDDFSGMSGGPMFWSVEDAYGIFGIVYEAGKAELFGPKSLIIAGEFAIPVRIRDWISQCHLKKP